MELEERERKREMRGGGRVSEREKRQECLIAM